MRWDRRDCVTTSLYRVGLGALAKLRLIEAVSPASCRGNLSKGNRRAEVMLRA